MTDSERAYKTAELPDGIHRVICTIDDSGNQAVYIDGTLVENTPENLYAVDVIEAIHRTIGELAPFVIDQVQVPDDEREEDWPDQLSDVALRAD